MSTFFQLQRDWPDEFCSITLIRKSPSVRHTAVYEAPCGHEYLSQFEITKFLPGVLPDILPNNNGWHIVSPRCREAIESIKSDFSACFTFIGDMSIGTCPNEIMQYSLISNAAVFDCLDLTSPELHWIGTEKTMLEKCSNLVFIEDRIPHGAAFFGVIRYPTVHVISKEVRDVLVFEKITGLGFKPCVCVSGRADDDV